MNADNTQCATPVRQHTPTSLPLPKAKGTMPVVDGILHADLLPPEITFELTAPIRAYREPYVGITADGAPAPGLYRLTDTGNRPTAAVDAADAYLDALMPFERTVARLPMNSPDWRLWTNAIPTWTPKGMRLERLTVTQRELALAVIEASLSREGFDLIRAAMQLNGALGELIDDYRDTLTEFTYWFTIFGDPTSGQPWGWQLMGHHIDVHCVFIGSQLVMAPVFLGAEPTSCDTGRYAGVHAFDDETGHGLTFRRSLTEQQESSFLLSRSISAPDPAGSWNGRHLAGAGSDNLILPAEGINGGELSADQQDLLLDLVRVYLRRLPALHAERKLEEVARHLDDTHFVWRGGHDDVCAFYYRIHSPILLVEYDNHPGVFLSNEEPARHHVHTIVREPGGNDYGKSLLAQHYATHHTPDSDH
ncbi:DUF3500 domain-containing protein [Streptomyces castrisilvae]|uniref:DUF3500 domain-containing protein n=1 Tax=Streptomyces castrisilvae TaxID=3033811 RepID=A0ABY9HRX7_9ACTN|nr:DUF3500 domain-containing protein [Streptomyces sp. Mut1]WLQ36763.1 DUF3500 domain-containing protein [Streptomyces sp. Mut1]